MATSPPDRFDPCRAWLGIDRADLADPRRVLGLVPGETDPIVVLKAAETRLKALKGLAAGQHHAAREGLILQVEQAREKVLSQIAAAGGAGSPGHKSRHNSQICSFVVGSVYASQAERSEDVRGCDALVLAPKVFKKRLESLGFGRERPRLRHAKLGAVHTRAAQDRVDAVARRAEHVVVERVAHRSNACVTPKARSRKQ